MQLAIWGWIVLIVGVIAAGIGLGYLIIYLFWRMERYYSSRAAIRIKRDREIKVEEPIRDETKMNVSPEVAVTENHEPEIKVDETIPNKEEAAVINIEGATPSGRNHLVKFAYILNSKFIHPFEKTDTIVCWDLALNNGDEVRDVRGNQMKLQVNKLPGETERVQHTLVDESGQHTVKVILAKEYLERETKLDLDKLKITK